MSKKRTSAEPSNDEETNEDSDVNIQREDNAKRGKLCTMSETTLQDIPTEILHCILVKAIAMEVASMKLPKSVRKEKADLVISRLSAVCSQWSSVLTTDFFRAELHRALDDIAPLKFRMEIVHVQKISHSAHCSIYGITMLKDDIFLSCVRNTREYGIKVYDRNNMADVKDVIEVPGVFGGDIAACNVSNCIFHVMKDNMESKCTSVLRISKDKDEKFNIHKWITDIMWSVSSMSVSEEGMVILSSRPERLGPHVINIYKPNGLMQHEIVLSQDVFAYEYIETCVMKSNGNLVLGSVYEHFGRHADLTEIDTNGIIQRQYKTLLEPRCDMIFTSFVDEFDRLLIHDLRKGIELLDSELKPLDFTGPQSDEDNNVGLLLEGLHFSRERNEVVEICSSYRSKPSLLKIFRLIVE